MSRLAFAAYRAPKLIPISISTVDRDFRPIVRASSACNRLSFQTGRISGLRAVPSLIVKVSESPENDRPLRYRFKLGLAKGLAKKP